MVNDTIKLMKQYHNLNHDNTTNNETELSRKPPAQVRRILRKEVKFVCPVKGCGNPYLSYHHFNPPWHERKHHDPAGMIALCHEHHDKADDGAFTKEQMRQLKTRPNNKRASGRFDWMRRDLVLALGSGCHHECLNILSILGKPVIWFERDPEGYLLLNVELLRTTKEPRLIIRNNDWIELGEPKDLECPPSGKQLKVIYSNGDKFEITFKEVNTIDQIPKQVAWLADSTRPMRIGDKTPLELVLPSTFVSIAYVVKGTPFSFTNTSYKLPQLEFQEPFFSRIKGFCFKIG
jgi:hypothetical protein